MTLRASLINSLSLTFYVKLSLCTFNFTVSCLLNFYFIQLSIILAQRRRIKQRYENDNKDNSLWLYVDGQPLKPYQVFVARVNIKAIFSIHDIQLINTEYITNSISSVIELTSKV